MLFRSDRWAPVEALLKRAEAKAEGAKGRIAEAQALGARFAMRVYEQVNQFVGTAVSDGVPQLGKADEMGVRTIEGVSGANMRKVADALAKAKVGNSEFTEQMFTTWLAILRAEQDGVGLAKLNFTTPLTDAQIAKIKNRVNSDPDTKAAFEEARKIYRQYNKDLMQLMVDTGVLDKEKAAELTAGDYVPYYRDNKGVVEMVVGNSKPVRIGSVVDQPELKALLGGDDKILPVFAGALQNTSMLMRMALRNMQTHDVANLLKDMGMGEILPGHGPGGATSITFKYKGDEFWFKPNEGAFPKDIPLELVVQGMQGIKTAVPALVKAMSYPANLLRKTVTRMPIYALRQVIRDPVHAWLTTGGNFTPVVSSVKELADMVRGKSKTELSLQQAGVISSNVFTGDTQDVARMLRDISGGKGVLSAAMAKFDAFALQGDAATRAVLYNTYREQGMTHAQALLGTLESMNFSRRGTSASMHWLSTMIPFFNAQVQGLDAVWRAMKGDTVFEDKMDARNTLFKRGLMVAVGTMAYALMMQDDDAYKNATPEERALNWFVRIPGVSEAVRIPIPFELGIIFKALPELIYNTAMGDTKAKDAAKAFGGVLLTQNPLGPPTAIKPVIELASNYNFYSRQPIESEREKGLNPSERFRTNTTELAKLLGKAGVSPIQIEHFVRSYTGSLGILLMSMPNMVLRPAMGGVEPPELSPHEGAVLGSLFQPNEGRGAINAAYEDVRQFQSAAQTYAAMAARDPKEAAAFANKFAMQIAMNHTGGAFKQAMGESAKWKRLIAADPKTTPAQKKEQIDRIKKYEIDYARQIKQFTNAS